MIKNKFWLRHWRMSLPKDDLLPFSNYQCATGLIKTDRLITFHEVVTANGTTSKHYYAGSQRIASRIEPGNPILRSQAARDSSSNTQNAEADFNHFADAAGFSSQEAELSVTANTARADFYFLHGDHLGTGTFVTNSSGQTTQFFLNLPFGASEEKSRRLFAEDWERSSLAEQNQPGDYNNPYKFNGKELDEETGLYYYGARFYDPRVSMWLSVDPLAEKMPGWSGYNYTFDNPVNFIDPTGMAPENDYKLLKNGDIKFVKETSDATDRILKTNKNGDVATRKNGKEKEAISGVAKGILSDGINFKKKDNLIAVDGIGQPKQSDIESFILKLSNYEGKEIGGSYYKAEGRTSVSHIGVGAYENNEYNKVKSSWGNFAFTESKEQYDANPVVGYFHIHPSYLSFQSRSQPSLDDLDLKNSTIKFFPNLKFYIITLDNGGASFKREYTND